MTTRRAAPTGQPVVVKVGSSSLASVSGGLDRAALRSVVDQVVELWSLGHPTVLVSSGAVAAGLLELGLDRRPADVPGLQVAAAVGQGRLMERYATEFGARDRLVGQVLLTKDVLANRGQYLHARQALDLFRLIIRYHTTPGLLEPRTIPETRVMKGLAMPMILIVTAQILREAVDDPICGEWIDRAISEIENDFMRPEFSAVLETVGPNGEFIDTFDGRMLCPGHAIEAAWFILHEAKHRGRDERLLQLALTILDWMWCRGWDEEYGGIRYYGDARDLPCTEYWHDMKFWWPHNEAVIATLLAYSLTGDAKYRGWHRMVHDWAHNHFPDREHGEWFGYLRRDGSLSTRIKGNMWKGPFHLPRMQLYCWKLLEEMSSRG